MLGLKDHFVIASNVLPVLTKITKSPSTAWNPIFYKGLYCSRVF